ncbi:MAG TPA: hypothetical protein VJZ04_11945 [Lachnospiraceae bacterium]|nr:hypothetical protein [Lachnospiraceae bacterium]
MKPLSRISLFLFVFCFVLLLGYFVYREFLEVPIETKEQIYENYAKEETDIIKVDTNNIEKIDCNTVYLIKAFDMVTEKEEECTEIIPAKYIGFTRKQLEEEFKQYILSPSLGDEKKGIVAIELISFSRTKVVIRKKFYVEPLPEKYFIVVENNFLTVYFKDLKTLFLQTDIVLEELPNELQQEIMKIKPFDTQEELYNFLESYTS